MPPVVVEREVEPTATPEPVVEPEEEEERDSRVAILIAIVVALLLGAGFVVFLLVWLIRQNGYDHRAASPAPEIEADEDDVAVEDPVVESDDGETSGEEENGANDDLRFDR